MSKKNASPSKEGAFQKTPLTEMMNLNELIKKENSYLQIYENFSVNPSKMWLYAEKPNVKRKYESEGSPEQTLKSAEEQPRDEVEEELMTKLSKFTYTPKQKYVYPATSSQEFGWYSDEMRTKSKRHPKKSCDETQYANAYYSMTGTSPYSSKMK